MASIVVPPSVGFPWRWTTLIKALHRSSADTASLTEACIQVICLQLHASCDSARVEPGESSLLYGLDSLSGVELHNCVSHKLDVTLSTLDIVNATSLLVLA